jgi:hypothetical protein
MDYIIPGIFIIIVLLSVIGVFVYRKIYSQSELKDSSKVLPKDLQDASGSLLQDSSGSYPYPPYVQTPIQNVDDYEYSLVFKNEGDRTMSKQTRNALLSQYPMDWTVQPPSSEAFQTGLSKFKESFENSPPQNLPIYSSIDGSSMVPPDSLADQQKEKEILQTYVPKKPQALTTYDIEDARELIEKIYDAKGLVPEYKQTGDNQFTIMGVRKKGQEVEEAQASSDPVPTQGENTILVPPHIDTEGSDPFFTPDENQNSTNPKNAKDYTRWTPGLERMFAPNAPMKNWY